MVCDLYEQEIEEIFEVRVELDALATRKAARHIKKSDINFLKRMADQFEKSVQREDFREMISVNENFHNYIYDLSKNRTLIQMIDQLKARGHILRYHAWSSPEILQRIQKEHKVFIKAFKEKDIELLDDLARRHISYSKNSYLVQLRAKKANLLNSRKA